MNLLSIQSHVAYGHVGNAAAVFPLQRMGVEVWPIHTVQLARTAEAGAREIQLIAAQDEIVSPSRVFAAEEIRA